MMGRKCLKQHASSKRADKNGIMRIVVQANAPHGQAEKEIARSGARSLVYSTKLRATFKATKKPGKAGKVFVVEDAKRTGEVVRLH